MPEYIVFPIEVNPEDLQENVYDYLQTRIPGWEPNAGNLDVWMAEAFSLWAADLRTAMSEVTDAIFRNFGESMIGIPPTPASAATSSVTVTARDNAGYLMPQGTLMAYRTAQDDLYPFETAADLVIAPGSTSGTVAIIAANVGAAASGLGAAAAAMELIDPIDWVTSVALVATTSGGQDAESDDAYLDRLRGELQLLTPRPILPQDFAALAINIPGVSRVIAIDGYNPATATYNNARMIALAGLDANGEAVSPTLKATIQSTLDGLREVTFVVNVVDPTYTYVDVTFSVKAIASYVPAQVLSSVSAALQSYFDPSLWGRSDAVVGGWLPQNTVRYLEVASVINSVDGVDYIQSLTIGVNGGAQQPIDFPLAGVAPLTRPGVITGSVS